MEMDQEAKALFKVLENYEDFNQELADGMAEELSRKNSIIAKRFERNVGTQKTYKKLKPKTVARKKKLGQRKVMVAGGTLKGKVLATIKGKVGDKKMEFTAKVPQYGKFQQEGKGKLPKREYFGLKNEYGRPQRVDVSDFIQTGNRVFTKLLREKGIKTRS